MSAHYRCMRVTLALLCLCCLLPTLLFAFPWIASKSWQTSSRRGARIKLGTGDLREDADVDFMSRRDSIKKIALKYLTYSHGNIF